MPMPLDEKKKGSIVAMITKKFKGPSFEDLKSDNETMEPKQQKDGAEQDYSDGLSQAVDEIFQAVESKDKESFKSGLKSFIQMCMDENSEEE